MSGFAILDLVLGMIFIYFLLSIICSSAVELWFAMLRTRAKLLEQWLKNIFDKPALNSDGTPLTGAGNSAVTLGQAIMDHCMVTALSGRGKATSYIDPQNFYSALIDKITLLPAIGVPAIQQPPKTLDECITLISDSPSLSGELKRTFLLLAIEAKAAAGSLSNIPPGIALPVNISGPVRSELEHFRKRIEGWYESNTRRLTETLKRTRAAPATFIVATLITVGLNTDSISIGKYLYAHKEITRQFADNAANSIRNFDARIATLRTNTDSLPHEGKSSLQDLDQKLQQVKDDIHYMQASVPQGLPIGWKSEPGNWLKHIAGWVVTILAICIGAPFWFDILNKITNLRSTGPKPGSQNDAGV